MILSLIKQNNNILNQKHANIYLLKYSFILPNPYTHCMQIYSSDSEGVSTRFIIQFYTSSSKTLLFA